MFTELSWWTKMFQHFKNIGLNISHLIENRAMIIRQKEHLEATQKYIEDIISHRDELGSQLKGIKDEREKLKERIDYQQTEIDSKDERLAQWEESVKYITESIKLTGKRIDRIHLFILAIRLLTIRYSAVNSATLMSTENSIMNRLTDDEVASLLDSVSKITDLSNENHARKLAAFQLLLEE